MDQAIKMVACGGGTNVVDVCRSIELSLIKQLESLGRAIVPFAVATWRRNSINIAGEDVLRGPITPILWTLIESRRMMPYLR